MQNVYCRGIDSRSGTYVCISLFVYVPNKLLNPCTSQDLPSLSFPTAAAIPPRQSYSSYDFFARSGSMARTWWCATEVQQEAANHIPPTKAVCTLHTNAQGYLGIRRRLEKGKHWAAACTRTWRTQKRLGSSFKSGRGRKKERKEDCNFPVSRT